jgi:hypothetical protein
MELHGRFGRMNFDYEGAPMRNYDAYKIKFKIGNGGEHEVYDENAHELLEARRASIKAGKAPESETEKKKPTGDKPVDYVDTLEDDMNEYIGELLVYMKDTDGV